VGRAQPRLQGLYYATEPRESDPPHHLHQVAFANGRRTWRRDGDIGRDGHIRRHMAPLESVRTCTA
jgi:hypothetical protein